MLVMIDNHQQLLINKEKIMKKKIGIYLFEEYADWEIAYLSPEINKNELFELIYISKDTSHIKSQGGLSIMPNRLLSDIKADDLDMIILPGGEAWGRNENREIDSLVLEMNDKSKNIAAICGATAYLSRLGLLDNVKHTSNDITYLKWITPEYSADNNYISAPAVSDKNIITAGGVFPIEFSKEIFKKIELKSDEDIENWFQLFKNGIWK